MIDFLASVDLSLFYFINTTLSNAVFDFIMPALTDWNQSWIGISVFGGCYLLFLWKGGRKGRIVGLLMIVMIICTDQLSSHVLKPLIARPRPCHEINGIAVVDHVRLLVTCGSGYSYPSSHAVNNFGLAVLLGYYYRRWKWLFLVYAFLMALSRVVVGVHFPSDVAGGGIIGAGCAYILIWLWNSLGTSYPWLRIQDPRGAEIAQSG